MTAAITNDFQLTMINISRNNDLSLKITTKTENSTTELQTIQPNLKPM